MYHSEGSGYVFIAYDVATTRFANFVKRIKGMDVIDDPKTTSYSPLAVK